MGQYYKICNLDRKELINPHTLLGLSKLMELTDNACGPLKVLAILTAVGNGRGFGDYRDTKKNPLAGRWAGDRIAIIGDYAYEGDKGFAHGVWDDLDTFKDITPLVKRRKAHLSFSETRKD